MPILKILIIATFVAFYQGSNLPTGLWLSELTHLYHKTKARGYDITIASPKGGIIPVDPESLKPLLLDKVSRTYWADTTFRELLAHSPSLTKLQDKQYDLIYLAGGHGTMYDFPKDKPMQDIIARHYERDKLIAAIYHGVGGY